MKRKGILAWTAAGFAMIASAGLFVHSASAHHSFAMYDQTKTLTLTGVAYQFVAQPNHAELHLYLIGPDGKLVKKDGKNVEWGVEMAGAAVEARAGISGATFPPGTIFSVKINPMRNGSNFGSRTGGIAKCPWKTPPALGKTCGTVAGVQVVGGTF